MARKSRAAELETRLQSYAPKNTLTTFRGQLLDERRASSLTQLEQTLRPGFVLPFERPTRNHADAYLVQEMAQVCSRLYRGLRKLAGDATMDESGSPQPFTILVEESLPKQREKIFNLIQKIIRRTKLGQKGPSRMFRMLLTGDAIGQPVASYEDGKAYLSDVFLMPTWEMHYNMANRQWSQVKEMNVGPKVIYTWESPDFMIRAIHDGDDNRAYGRPALLNLSVNYRQYIATLEDLYVACRTRAPRRLIHYLGTEDGTWRVDRNALAAYKRRNELGGNRTIYTDYYLSRGFEEIKDIPGDSAACQALLDVLKYRENVMLEDLGLPSNMQDLAGRHVSESVDAAYASTINTLRAEDSRFITDAVRRGLLIEGVANVDIEITIPPLGEPQSVRWDRVLKAYHNGDVDFATACGLIGLNNPYAIRRRIEEDMAWIDDNPNFMTYFNRTGRGEKQGAGLPGSEAASSGADTKKAERRRTQQKQAGKKNPSGA